MEPHDAQDGLRKLVGGPAWMPAGGTGGVQESASINQSIKLCGRRRCRHYSYYRPRCNLAAMKNL